MRRLAFLLPLVLPGCQPAPNDARPVSVEVVAARDPSGDGADPFRRVLTGATAQGLVRLDAAGQVEPGVAERWSVLDDGRSYIFRLRADASWPDGRPVTAPDAAAAIRRAAAPGARNPAAPWLGAVRNVVAMTPQVIELRLSAPRPALLTLLAQPDLAVVHGRRRTGSGPFRRDRSGGLLRPIGEDGAVSTYPADAVRLRSAPGALAVARFRRGTADLVLGGGVADWPLVAAGDVPAAAVRIDPAAGLFGFAIVSREGLLATPLGRAAVAMALADADLPGAIDARWAATTTTLPERLDSGADPALPPWRNLSAGQRLATARAQVLATGAPVRLRVALPAGPGGTRLWGRVAAGLARIGVATEPTGQAGPADLVLVDAVAPHDNARWYLATACRGCSSEVRDLLDAARDARDTTRRAALLARADAALAADVAFVAIARPWRWSLVAPRLDGFRTNPRAWHPLNRLRAEPR